MTVSLETNNGVAWIRLDRPERRNALGPDMAAALASALETARDDGNVRCAVLAAAGDHFCVGADLGELRTTERMEHPLRFLDWSRHNFAPAVTALFRFPKPIVAAVRGQCVGIGWNLALSCDLVLAGRSARFSQIFVRRGLVPDGGGTHLLARHVGLMRAREIMYSGRFVDAQEALRLGLAVDVVNDDELDQAAQSRADSFAVAPTRALELTKRLLNDAPTATFEAAIEHELQLQALLSQTVDVREGVASFLDKRPPRYVGD